MKTKYIGMFVLLLLCFNSELKAQKDSICYKNINSDDLYLLNESSDIMLVDVRLRREYKKGRIHNAHSATKKAELKQLLNGIDKEENIYIYCVMGVESKMASKYVCKELGYSNVYNLQGGITKWKKKGFSIDDTKLKPGN